MHNIYLQIYLINWEYFEYAKSNMFSLNRNVQRFDWEKSALKTWWSIFSKKFFIFIVFYSLQAITWSIILTSSNFSIKCTSRQIVSSILSDFEHILLYPEISVKVLLLLNYTKIFWCIKLKSYRKNKTKLIYKHILLGTILTWLFKIKYLMMKSQILWENKFLSKKHFY